MSGKSMMDGSMRGGDGRRGLGSGGEVREEKSKECRMRMAGMVNWLAALMGLEKSEAEEIFHRFFCLCPRVESTSVVILFNSVDVLELIYPHINRKP